MENFKNLNPKARYSLLITAIITNIIIFAILLGIKNALEYFKFGNPVMFWFKVIYFIAIAYMALNIILEPTLGYKIYKYRINDESIETKDGIIFQNHTIIPIRRMQQITIDQGPINKILGLANLQITTAGSELIIYCIDIEEAKMLSSVLGEKINLFAQKGV